MTTNRSARQVLAALLVVISAAGLLAIAVPARAADEPDFKARMRKVMDAWQTMDPVKAAPFYAKEGNALFFDIAPLKYVGWNAYAAGTSQIFSQWTSVHMTINDDIWIERHGDIAITAATGRGEVMGKDGSKESLDWRWTAFWEKKGKEWLIAHEHLSTPWEPSAAPTGE